MSSGLSMTSVNKIKELAEAKEYSLAVEILDSQDLEKSLNPQFLRICGEVYENVGRAADARNMYVKAHAMGPASNRILFSLITFYLKQGYFELAEQYVEQYRYNARGAAQELKNIDYVVKKAKGAEPDELESFLEPYYSHNMDEEWSFELFLLHRLQGKDTEMLAADYMATFRRRAGRDVMQEVLDGQVEPEELFYVYAEHPVPDQDPEEEEIRELEREQLKKDYLRMHPESGKDDETLEDSGEKEEDAAEIIDTPDTEQKFKSFLKRTFRKKAKDEPEAEAENADEASGQAEADSGENQEAEETDKTGSEEESVTETPEPAPTDTGDTGEKPEASEAPDEVKQEKEAEPKEENDRLKGFVSRFSDRGRNKNEMQEIEADPMQDVFSVDFDDGFAAESDSISDLAETETEAYQNPFDLINAYKIDRKEKEEIRETYGNVPKDLKDTFDAVKKAAEESIMKEEPVEEPKEEPIPWEEPEKEETFTPEPVMEEEPEEEPMEEEPEEEPIPWEEPEKEETFTPEPVMEEEPEGPAEEEPEEIRPEQPEPVEKEAEPKKSAFDVLVEKESEKLDEGLLEEERLQKEAEELLASLGIKL